MIESHESHELYGRARCSGMPRPVSMECVNTNKSIFNALQGESIELKLKLCFLLLFGFSTLWMNHKSHTE